MNDVPPTPAPAPALSKSGRGLRIALAISVALNLAIAGLVAGAVLRNHAPGGREDVARELGFGPFTEALSREDRRALRQRRSRSRSLKLGARSSCRRCSGSC